MDVLKDAFEAMSQRIRSPIVGSIVLSFLVINWKALAYLLFADHPLLVRFAFWDGNTDWVRLYLLPFVTGTALAFILPWTKLAGAWISQVPTRKLRVLQAENARLLRIGEAEGKRREEAAIAKLSAQREEVRIEEEKRLQTAASLSTELSEEIKTTREGAQSKISEHEFEPLSDYERRLLGQIAARNAGTFELHEYNGQYSISLGNENLDIPNRKEFLKANEAIKSLRQRGLIESSRDKLTLDAYSVLNGIEDTQG